MREVAVYLICAVSVVAFSSFVSYSGEEGKAGNVVLGIILLSSLTAPIPRLLSELSFSVEALPKTSFSDSSCGVIEDAYCEGIAIAVSDKFGIDVGSIEVMCDDFSQTDLKAENVLVKLSDSSVYADIRGIRSYLEKICECSVRIEIG